MILVGHRAGAAAVGGAAGAEPAGRQTRTRGGPRSVSLTAPPSSDSTLSAETAFGRDAGYFLAIARLSALVVAGPAGSVTGPFVWGVWVVWAAGYGHGQR